MVLPSSIITAEVKDSPPGNPVLDQGTEVAFSTNLGTFKNGGASYTAATDDDSGIVTVALIREQNTGSQPV